MAGIKPLGGRVVVEVLDSQETVKGGIIIPDTAKEKPQQAKIIEVGPGAILESGERRPIDVKKGDVVLFGKYSGTEVKYNDTEYLILNEDDILAIVS